MFKERNVARAALPTLVRLTQEQRVKVLFQPCELQLSFCDLVQGDLQQAVLVQLAQVMYTWWWEVVRSASAHHILMCHVHV